MFGKSSHRDQKSKRQSLSWVGWETPPETAPISGGEMSNLGVLPIIQGGLNPEKYQPAIIIGLGQAGEVVLRQWMRKIEQGSDGPQTRLRSILLTFNPLTDSLPEAFVKTRIYQFGGSERSVSRIPGRAQQVQVPFESQRGHKAMELRQPYNRRRLQDYFHTCQIELQRNIQVVLVASMAEDSIGLLGDILQLLYHQKMNSTVPLFSKISAVLSLNPVEKKTALPKAEMYAAMREIARFTCVGEHFIEQEITGADHSYMAAAELLHHVILIEENGPGNNLNLRHVPFEQGTGQAMAEIVYSMLHPGQQSVWEYLPGHDTREELFLKGKKEYRSVMHSVGIATLETPQAAMRDYFAVRLAKAVIYGERADRPDEGLLPLTRPAASYSQEGEMLARAWLSDMPSQHPVFTWLEDEGDPSRLNPLPPVAPLLEDALQIKIGQGLVDTLNSPDEIDALAKCRLALFWLEEKVQQVATWFNQINYSGEVPNLADWRVLYTRWLEMIASYRDQLEAWENCLYPQKDEDIPRFLYPAQDDTKIPSLQDIIQQEMEQAKTCLRQAAEGKICCSLPLDEEEMLEEADRYYVESVRRELSLPKNPNCEAFRSMRKRIGWWVERIPGKEARLELFFIPPEIDCDLQGFPSFNSLYSPDTIHAFFDRVCKLAASLLPDLQLDLSGRWFEQRLPGALRFLRRAELPLLDFDLNTAPPAAHSFLIGEAHQETLRDYAGKVFPDKAHEVNLITTGVDAGRLTALTIWENIPDKSIDLIKAAYGNYAHQPRLHFYSQERQVAVYETRIREQIGRYFELAPQLVFPFYNAWLVTLFFQALIVQKLQRQDDYPHYKWVISPFNEFEEVVLETHSSEPAGSLWQALEDFSIRIPFQRYLPDDLKKYPPQHPLHPSNFQRYFADLSDHVKQARGEPSHAEQRDSYIEDCLPECLSENTSLMNKTIGNLIRAEMKRPVAENW